MVIEEGGCDIPPLCDGRQQQGRQSYATIGVGGDETFPHHEFIDVTSILVVG